MNSRQSTPSKFGVRFKASAYHEFKQLDGSVKPKVAAQLLKTQRNPLAGEPLGNRMGIDLTGYRRIYVDRKRIRIVWQVRAEEVVIVIVGIGPRDKGEIYHLVAQRFREQDLDPSGNPSKHVSRNE